MKVRIAAHARNANYLALVIDVKREIAEPLCRSAQIAQIGHRARFPKQCVIRLEIEQSILIESCARAGRAGNLAVVVDCHGHSVRVSSKGRKLLDLALLPDGRLKLEFLRGRAARVRRGVFSESDDIASTVDLVGLAVIAPESWQRNHHAVLPQRR